MVAYRDSASNMGWDEMHRTILLTFASDSFQRYACCRSTIQTTRCFLSKLPGRLVAKVQSKLY